jgi:hypothetical protein
MVLSIGLTINFCRLICLVSSLAMARIWPRWECQLGRGWITDSLVYRLRKMSLWVASAGVVAAIAVAAAVAACFRNV